MSCRKVLIEQNKIIFKLRSHFFPGTNLHRVCSTWHVSVQGGEESRALNPKPNFRIFFFKKGGSPKIPVGQNDNTLVLNIVN